MLPSNTTDPIYTDAEKAREYLEAIRWPDGPVCPHCGVVNSATLMKGKAHRPGLYQCKECAKQFSVTVGTLYERSHIPLNKWLLATRLLCSSKKGISAHQLYRDLGFGSYRTAWFMAHRIREGMRVGELAPPMGGEGKTVEVDETVIGRLEGQPKKFRSGYQAYRNTVLTLVERGGVARSFHVESTTVGQLIPIVKANIAHETAVMTDSASWYRQMNRDGSFASHDSVDHSKDEYARYEGEKVISTNTVEGYYSIFKRGMKGVYQHCSEKHLHRYLAEFDFRYSHRVALGIDDATRAVKALEGISGKRLTYRRIDQA
ncbi:MAG: IS1595 family transposase [Methylovirgula sp.]|nr:IS1595 family transposase [Methylovirgula sp.]